MRLGPLRWLILGLLFLSTVINYVDRQALSVLLPTLRGELGLSGADYGVITTVFMLAYAPAQVPVPTSWRCTPACFRRRRWVRRSGSR